MMRRFAAIIMVGEIKIEQKMNQISMMIVVKERNHFDINTLIGCWKTRDVTSRNECLIQMGDCTEQMSNVTDEDNHQCEIGSLSISNQTNFDRYLLTEDTKMSSLFFCFALMQTINRRKSD